MKKLTALLALILLFQLADARNNRRGDIHHSAMDRAWTYRDLSHAAHGSFLNAKDGEVYIIANGEVLSFPIHNLHWVDRKYISSRLKKIESLTKWQKEHSLASYQYKEPQEYKSDVRFSLYTQALIIFTFSASCFLLAWIFRSSLKRQMKLAVALLMLVSSLMVITQRNENLDTSNAIGASSKETDSHDARSESIANFPYYMIR